MSTPDMTIDVAGLIEELRALTPDELNVWIKLTRGNSAYAETCVHEAAHAVFADRLCVPFDYVTVCPTVLESGVIMAGHVRWKDIGQMTRDSFENWALAVIAPQIVLSRFGIEQTIEEMQEEFSADNATLDIIVRYAPELTRSYLMKQMKDMISNAVLLEIHRLAEELKDRKTLTAKEVRELFSA